MQRCVRQVVISRKQVKVTVFHARQVIIVRRAQKHKHHVRQGRIVRQVRAVQRFVQQDIIVLVEAVLR